MPHTPITRLTLQHFRNHAHFELEPRASILALVGPNGAGKTNILEALSLLSPGKGLRNSSYREMLQHGSLSHEWVVAAEVEKDGEAIPLGTRYVASEASEKRQVRAEGEDLRQQAHLTRYVSLFWLTPAMSHLFNEGGSARRKFLDRLVYGFDQEHASRIYSFEHHLRERNRLLAEHRADPLWLETLEQKIAEYSVAIAVARREALQHLVTAPRAAESAFPVAEPQLEGIAEQALAEGAAAVAVEECLREALARARREDERSGRTSIGAHRSALTVWFPEKKQEAAECSTGEQKALLFSLVLAYARARKHWRGAAPVLLLDEVVAHLDEGRRRALFSEISAAGAQAFLTGTDDADFSVSDEVERLALGA